MDFPGSSPPAVVSVNEVQPVKSPRAIPIEPDEGNWDFTRKPLITVRDVIEYWDDTLQKGNLSCHHFRIWWREQVPKILAPKMSMNYLAPQAHIDEDKFTEILIRPLERFLCGATFAKSPKGRPDDPAVILKQLCELNDPPTTCGKLFRMGEPTYSCRDCGHDSTCVLCAECFKNSEHRHHRYKMSTSSGGGYCDCGDSEAWSEFAHCTIHSAGQVGLFGQSQLEDPALKLPEDIQKRAEHLFYSVMNYIFEMLTTEIMLTLPADLIVKNNCESSELDFEVGERSRPGRGASDPGEEDYVTVIYNDEFHTFDEVISTLPRAVECERQTALGFATMIDREGRIVVKCAGFQPCSEVKNITERITSRRGGKPLKVVIMHCLVWAHQNFALRLLAWMQSILGSSAGFRSIFAKMLLDKRNTKVSRLEEIFRHDTRLWKQARTQMHHLLVAGMLLDNYETKRLFAEVFTRCYGQMMKDFTLDDHDHSFSVTSLSVQLFTVPTLAHHLISKCDVLGIAFRTFMSECERKRNDRGKLEFQRNYNPQSFRRAVYILFDLKYLLTTPPIQSNLCKGWEDGLRKGFLHGVTLLVDVLSWMQGMGLQVRQINQHVEFEFEWETAFNLHMRLAPIFTFVLNWCGTDRIVLIKTIRVLLRKLFEDLNTSPDLTGVKQTVSIANKQWEAECIDYVIQVKPVSIHAPLTRMLAGLSLFMEKFDLHLTDSHELDIVQRPTILELIEPSLRASVLVAQVHAGMWRRNGYSLIDQVKVYHDPRCRREMQDQDITMLQLGASLMPPNDFLINLLNKFSLVHWSDREFDCSEEDSIRQTTTIVEEFFSLLIMIVGERYVPGVGQVQPEDALRREIIHLLCEGPMSHSALNKALSDDGNKETGLEKVIDSVATFKKPNPSLSVAAPAGKGSFELRPEFYSEYNVFFYHYTKEEQSKSEEAQRLRKRARNEPECHPPPPLPPLTKQFSGIANLMQSDVFLYLISLVLERADNLKSKGFSENQVHRVLHLIGLSLREEEANKLFEFTSKSEKFNIFGLMEQLVGSQRIESHKHLLNWTIKKWQEVAGCKTFDLNSSNSTSMMSESESTLEGPSTSIENSPMDAELALKKRVAAERRKKLLAQMQSAQNNFMKENAKLFEETPSGLDAKAKLASEQALDEMEVKGNTEIPICLGTFKTSPTLAPPTLTCILCLLEDELHPVGKSFVIASFVQKSTVLSNRRRGGPTSSFMYPAEDSQKMSTASSLDLPGFELTSDESLPGPSSASATTAISLIEKARTMALAELKRRAIWDSQKSNVTSLNSQFPLLSADLHCSTYASSCGHVMHATCWKTHFDDIVMSDRQRNRNRHPPSFDTEKSEFLCPLCRTLSNTVIPVLPQFLKLQPPATQSTPVAQPVPVDSVKIAELSSKGSESANDSSIMTSDTKNEDLDFSEWIHALLISMKYKKELKPTDVEVKQEPPEFLSTFTSPRFYTCPLDQVAQEMTQAGMNHSAFEKLFLDRGGQALLQFSPNVFNMMNTFSQAIFRIGLDTQPGVTDERTPLAIWRTCAFTIHAAVWQGLDGLKKSIVDVATMSSRQHQCLTALVRFCGIVGSNFGEPKVVRSHSLRLLSTLLEVDIKNPSILEFDAFGILVALTFSLPSLFNGDQAAPLPSGNIQDAHILRLVFVAHIVQILLTTDQFSCEIESEESDGGILIGSTDPTETRPILELLHLVRDAVGFASESDGSEGLRSESVWNDIKIASLPFLRCAALFYHHLTSVPGPPDLVHFSDNEFDVLAKYMSLPSTPADLLGPSSQLMSLAKKWANHPNVHITLKTDPSRATSYPLKVKGLVPLPLDYSELINSVSTFTCPRSQSEDSRVPAMCLICGEVICSQSYCCQVTMGDGKNVGGCTAHAEICGAGNGIFLRVRECKVVLLSGRTKGCFVQPPYVDQYGETDIGLRRGNPLHLCPERYQKLAKYWLNHSIPEEIAHVLESNHYLIATPWFHL